MATNNGHADTRTKKILFMTHTENGQANTILAMALEASMRPYVEVHIASFPVLKGRVERLSPKLHFHQIDGKDMTEVYQSHGFFEQEVCHPPTTKSFKAYGRGMALAVATWDGESHVRICDSIKKVIEELDPGIVVVDSLLNVGLDACYSLGRRFVLNSPNTPLDVTRAHQPWLKGFWYYPFTGTGISFPISFIDILYNIMAAIALIWMTETSPEVTELNKYRNAHGLLGRLPMESAATRAVHVICPGVRETDFPLVIPDYLGLYGPIVLDTTPVDISDPELNVWLNRGETVLMCMGSHFCYTESQVKAVINGFLSAVPHNSNIQFLWKLPKKSDFEDLLEETLKDPRDQDRFRVVEWLEAEPASIMKHSNVVVWIHHGGANSYFEGTLAGLPQIILAQWYDLYDMAVRAEYLGIGIYGNKNAAPDFEAVEFGTAVARLVLPGKELEEFRTRAKVVAEACRKAGGKRTAVDKLIEIVDCK